MSKPLASVVPSVAVSVLLAMGCASQRNVVEKLRPDVYRLKCQKELPQCLAEEAEARCGGNHYIVVRAVNELNLRGAVPNQMEARSSEAIIQCGPAHNWSGIGKPMEGADKPFADKPFVDKPKTGGGEGANGGACTPGATQACVGPGACQGGQSCRPDGGGYGPCDCGGAPAPPPAPAPDGVRPPS